MKPDTFRLEAVEGDVACARVIVEPAAFTERGKIWLGLTNERRTSSYTVSRALTPEQARDLARALCDHADAIDGRTTRVADADDLADEYTPYDSYGGLSCDCEDT